MRNHQGSFRKYSHQIPSQAMLKGQPSLRATVPKQGNEGLNTTQSKCIEKDEKREANAVSYRTTLILKVIDMSALVFHPTKHAL